MSGRKGAAGFTLIEAMIIVAVIGILTAVAMPMYQDSMRKSRRSDAMRELMELASRQERFYAQNGVYTNNVDGEFGLDWGSQYTRGEHYKLGVIKCLDSDGEIEFDKCYVLQAVPPDNSDQKGDLCATLSIDSRGQRKSSNTRLEKECW